MAFHPCGTSHFSPELSRPQISKLGGFTLLLFFLFVTSKRCSGTLSWLFILSLFVASLWRWGHSCLAMTRASLLPVLNRRPFGIDLAICLTPPRGELFPHILVSSLLLRNSRIRDRGLIRIIRRRYCGLSPRSIHFRLLWPPNVDFCRRSAGHTGCCAPGRCSDYPDADRWSIHRGCSNWSNVCHYSRVLCMYSSINPSTASDVNFRARLPPRKFVGCWPAYSNG